MTRSRSTRFAGLLLAASLLFLVGCRGEVTPIRSLLDDPGSYDGKTVRVVGTCAGGMGILGYGAYQVDDGTGKLLVVTESGGAPREGAKIGVEGTFRSAFTLKTETVAALVETKRYEP